MHWFPALQLESVPDWLGWAVQGKRGKKLSFSWRDLIFGTLDMACFLWKSRIDEWSKRFWIILRQSKNSLLKNFHLYLITLSMATSTICHNFSQMDYTQLAPLFQKKISRSFTKKHRVFASQEAPMSKDVERAFGILVSRWYIFRNPIRLRGRTWIENSFFPAFSCTIWWLIQGWTVMHIQAAQPDAEFWRKVHCWRRPI